MTDGAQIELAARSLFALRSVDRVFYAQKANSNRDVLQRVERLGFGLECVSPGEIALTLELFPDIDRSRILFTPNFAPRREYEEAFSEGVHVTLDNLHPIEFWPEVFRGREIFVRVDPGHGRGHHHHVRTAGTESKFGVDEDELQRLRDLADAVQCRVIGLHAHKGSGILDQGPWRDTGLFLGELAKRMFPDVRVINVGGGLGVVEKPGQLSISLGDLDDSLAEVKQRFPGLEIWLEPGRFVVANAGVLLATVTQIKRKGAVTWVGLDAGMNSLIRPALYGAYHEIVNLSRLGEPTSMTVSVVGPICESGDTLGYMRRVAPVQEGDVMLIATAGAYGHVMSSRYNLREPAREVFLAS